jgi:hypothetical protein
VGILPGDLEGPEVTRQRTMLTESVAPTAKCASMAKCSTIYYECRYVTCQKYREGRSGGQNRPKPRAVIPATKLNHTGEDKIVPALN